MANRAISAHVLILLQPEFNPFPAKVMLAVRGNGISGKRFAIRFRPHPRAGPGGGSQSAGRTAGQSRSRGFSGRSRPPTHKGATVRISGGACGVPSLPRSPHAARQRFCRDPLNLPVWSGDPGAGPPEIGETPETFASLAMPSQSPFCCDFVSIDKPSYA